MRYSPFSLYYTLGIANCEQAVTQCGVILYSRTSPEDVCPSGRDVK